jgi:hypothetical protein
MPIPHPKRFFFFFYIKTPFSGDLSAPPPHQRPLALVDLPIEALLVCEPTQRPDMEPVIDTHDMTRRARSFLQKHPNMLK